ncbi:MAG: DUF3177 family protein [Leptolyngbyaceae cyanobacterium SL_1_1]|nr:DUF3177 family protein [Leptolyngbyaceae cyanobacterium RM1_1_2]NJO09062.1 DUF3177 family protein [Leptolyngbyaceae cyanobacterium SL_1_1]
MFSPSVLQTLVWTDYRLAVLFTVILPLILLIWTFIKKSEAIGHLLTIYWKVASLLAITVYLMIGGFAFSFITALMARILIPLSLWFWEDLNEEIDDHRITPLKLAFAGWRWAITLYSVVGAFLEVSFLRCAFSKAAFSSAACQTWLEPPLLYKEYFHAGTTYGFLGFLGIVGLVVYLLSLGYFVFFRLGKQGRTATYQ